MGIGNGGNKVQGGQNEWSHGSRCPSARTKEIRSVMLRHKTRAAKEPNVLRGKVTGMVGWVRRSHGSGQSIRQRYGAKEPR